MKEIEVHSIGFAVFFLYCSENNMFVNTDFEICRSWYHLLEEKWIGRTQVLVFFSFFFFLMTTALIKPKWNRRLRLVPVMPQAGRILV